MKRIVTLVACVFFVTFAAGASTGECELIFLYNVSQEINQRVEIYQGDQLLGTVMPGKSGTIRVHNGKHNFKAQIGGSSKTLGEMEINNNRVYINIDVIMTPSGTVNISKFHISKQEALPTQAAHGSVATSALPRASAPTHVSNGGSFFTDTRDGKRYKIVTIGGKTWMAENLNYQIGNSWCDMNNNSNCAKYGRLYDWNTAKIACPTGWQLSSRSNWDELVKYAGGVDAGKKLKARSGWKSNGNGTDDYGFSSQPGGYRDSDGYFFNAGNNGYWWTATEGGDYAYNRYMYYYDDDVDEGYRDRRHGLSVRCVKDVRQFGE